MVIDTEAISYRDKMNYQRDTGKKESEREGVADKQTDRETDRNTMIRIFKQA